jgi:group I intron endonuclease
MPQKFSDWTFPGIYSITHIDADGNPERRYIGSSKLIVARLRKHRSQLRSNTHKSHHLQNAWNAYGERAFRFEVIERCPMDEATLIIREQFWLNHYEGNAYNTRKTANSTVGMKLNLTDEQKEHRRQQMYLLHQNHPRPRATNYKLNPEDIIDIFNRYASGESTFSISKHYKVYPGTINDIIDRNTWYDIEIAPEIEATCKDVASKEKRHQKHFDHNVLPVEHDEVIDSKPEKQTRNRKRLSTDEVRQIKRFLSYRLNQVSLARKFGISTTTVQAIKNGQAYADIEPAPDPSPLLPGFD